MEIITITSVVASMVIIAFIAYSFGKEQGRLQFKNKVYNYGKNERNLYGND